MTNILVEVAPGELIDKITILDIKLARIADPQKRRNVAFELSRLTEARTALAALGDGLDALTADLRRVNEALWDIEDAIRDCERDQDFGPTFIDLARRVYKTNDRRAELKRRINELCGSHIIEEKSYAAY